MRGGALAAACALVLTTACAGGGNADGGSASDAAGADPACETFGADAALSCVKPCAHGNDRFVGEFCTPGGGQCDDNLSQVSGAASFCTVDFSNTTTMFCTKPCQDDVQCGTGAVCRDEPDGGQRGCVPNSCL